MQVGAIDQRKGFEESDTTQSLAEQVADTTHLVLHLRGGLPSQRGACLHLVLHVRGGRNSTETDEKTAEVAASCLSSSSTDELL